MKVVKLVLLFLTLFLFSCTEKTTQPENANDIPPDPANVTVPTPTINNVKPAVSTPAIASGVVTTNLTGMIGNDSKPLELVYNPDNTENSTIFITEDDIVKGLKLVKVSSTNTQQADIVFTVDNSGSMGEEADSVAAGIIEFAKFLVSNGLDVKFGIVGYYGSISGAINLTDKEELESFLTSRYGYDYYGTSRTMGFAGPDSAALELAAYEVNNTVTNGENGVIGVLYANSNFSWRPSAQRVFINFTDEPTQSDGVKWTTAEMCSEISGSATVHTVFSRDSSYYSWSTGWERPWEMSECTGGTIMFIDDQASGLNLTTLPFSTALINSYTVSYNGKVNNSTHTIVITINAINGDGKTEIEWEY